MSGEQQVDSNLTDEWAWSDAHALPGAVDVAIIGGGIVGCSAAYFLARRACGRGLRERPRRRRAVGPQLGLGAPAGPVAGRLPLMIRACDSGRNCRRARRGRRLPPGRRAVPGRGCRAARGARGMARRRARARARHAASRRAELEAVLAAGDAQRRALHSERRARGTLARRAGDRRGAQSAARRS